ncbi:hypothetical protein NE237_010846 [Protea cynaroides]|uniref:Uncharacterized protein n=1 Tax=Protea cynaroides TaxID=273540 RepID=A0A9Q0L0J2_9MAGN|nr:hypothetical protein NE237_010846 [Protea cynaroides]
MQSFQGNGFKFFFEGPDPNLPHKCTPGCGITMEKPNDRFGVFLDQKTKNWIDRKTGSNCFVLFPRYLSFGYYGFRVTYEVAFMVMINYMDTRCKGPVKLELITPNGDIHQRTENILDKPKGQWMEIRVPQFHTGQDKDGDMTFSLNKTNMNFWNLGIVVKGVIIRPKTVVFFFFCFFFFFFIYI